jgi:hypothetical protein
MLRPKWIWPRDSVPASYNSRGAANPWRVTMVTWWEFTVLHKTWTDTETIRRIDRRRFPMLSSVGGHRVRETWIYFCNLFAERCWTILHAHVTSSQINSFNLYILDDETGKYTALQYAWKCSRNFESIFTHQLTFPNEDGECQDCFMFPEMLWRKGENPQYEIQRVNEPEVLTEDSIL